MHLAASLDVLRAGVKLWDFTLPAGRLAPFVGEAGDLVVVGMPVYAGRLPNLLVPYLKTWQGKGAYVVPVVVYGNRSYGNALIELRDILTKTGFRPLGAAAFVGEQLRNWQRGVRMRRICRWQSGLPGKSCFGWGKQR